MAIPHAPGGTFNPPKPPPRPPVRPQEVAQALGQAYSPSSTYTAPVYHAPILPAPTGALNQSMWMAQLMEMPQLASVVSSQMRPYNKKKENRYLKGAGRSGQLAQFINDYLANRGSPMAGTGGTFVRASRRGGIDPLLLMAISGQETEYGTTGNAGAIHNAFGMGPGIKYPSWKAGIRASAKNLSEKYFAQGLDTIQEIGGKWAPIGVSNDPTNLNANWPGGVSKIYQSLVRSRSKYAGAPKLFPIYGGQDFNWGGGPEAHGGRSLGNWQSDNAYDLMAPAGTPVYSVSRGRIAPDMGFGPQNSGNPLVYGSRLHLNVPGGNTLFYTHMDHIARNLDPGDRVRAGQYLGTIADYGSADHIHFASQYGDPARWLKAGGRAPTWAPGGPSGTPGPGYASPGPVTPGMTTHTGAAPPTPGHDMAESLYESMQGGAVQGRRRSRKGRSSEDAILALLQSLGQINSGMGMM